MRINRHHPLIQIRILRHQNLRIKRHGHEERRHSTLNWHQEDIADLQSDDEREGHDDGRVAAGSVVRGRRESDVEVGEQGAGIGNEDGAHGQDGVDETFVDEGVDTAVFHHAPGGFGGGDVGFAVEGYVGECVFVDCGGG